MSEMENNTSKAENLNNGGSGGSYVSTTEKREYPTTPADSNESTLKPPTEIPANVGIQQHQQQTDEQHHDYFVQNIDIILAGLIQNYHPSMLLNYTADGEENACGPIPRVQSAYGRYHPYQQPQHLSANRTKSTTSTSRRDSLQCDKCGAVFYDTHQLVEHVRSTHVSSPCTNSYSAPPNQLQQLIQPLPQYLPLSGSPQQQQQYQMQQYQHQQQEYPQEPGYDLARCVMVNNDFELESEEPTDILDLDSRNDQMHNIRYQEEHMELQQQLQQLGDANPSVTAMLSCQLASQPHDYHADMASMGLMGTVKDSNKFMRVQQQMPLVEIARCSVSFSITNTQPMPADTIQQNLESNADISSGNSADNVTNKCVECNKVFTKPCYLTQHNKCFHSGERLFKCDKFKCGKRFVFQNDYERHLDKHNSVKPHKCDKCSKGYMHKADLIRHMFVHSASKPFECHVCPKGFVRQDHLRKHVETHNRKCKIKERSS